MAHIRAFAHGGGVQSTAALVLSAQGRIDFPTHLFCHVGEDSENPATLDYVEQVSIPFARDHGIDFHVLRYEPRDPGAPRTLLADLVAHERSIKIPVHHFPSGFPATRVCTNHFKIRVLGRWLKARGASPTNKATVGLGISTDEIEGDAERPPGRAGPGAGLPPPLGQPPPPHPARAGQPLLFARGALLLGRVLR